MKTIAELKNVAEYLNDKKVPFAIKTNCLTNTISIIGVKITKEGKFFKANGIIIAGNMAQYFI